MFGDLHSRSFVDGGWGVPSQNMTELTGRLWQWAPFIEASVGTNFMTRVRQKTDWDKKKCGV